LYSVKYGNNDTVNVLNFSEKEYLDDNEAKGMWILWKWWWDKQRCFCVSLDICLIPTFMN